MDIRNLFSGSEKLKWPLMGSERGAGGGRMNSIPTSPTGRFRYVPNGGYGGPSLPRTRVETHCRGWGQGTGPRKPQQGSRAEKQIKFLRSRNTQTRVTVIPSSTNITKTKDNDGGGSQKSKPLLLKTPKSLAPECVISARSGRFCKGRGLAEVRCGTVRIRAHHLQHHPS